MNKKCQEDLVTYNSKNTVFSGQISDVKPQQRNLAKRGAQLLCEALIAEGVEVLFGYPGGANLEIFDALPEYGIRCIRVEHEQGAIHAAQGYARSTGRVGVCLATSGPGATNLVTGIADSNSDSTPVVAITGNVPSHLLGRNAFQEVDIVSICKPITKSSYQVKKVIDLPVAVRTAFATATSNRSGPVLIDIPKDIQQQIPHDVDGNYLAPTIPAVIESPEIPIGAIPIEQLKLACELIEKASRPVIYAGGGIISTNGHSQLLALAEKLQCPVTTTLMGIGGFPPDHSLSLHVLGMHGSKYANVAINEADLVIALGVRFDDRVTGKLETFIEHGKIIHIDIDKKELNKNKPVTLPICANLQIALKQLVEFSMPGNTTYWIEKLANLKQRYPFSIPEKDTISPQLAIAILSNITRGEAIVSLGVGQHQMWAMQHYQAKNSRAFISSSGFGTMGFGLPAAIGAKVANPLKQVIDIDGDGSLNMTIHELATCHRYGIGVKIVVINNQWLGMVRQWQDMIYKKHRSGTDLSDPLAVKVEGEHDIYPDFIKIAEGYRVKAERVTDKNKLAEAYERMLSDPDQPYLLDVIVDAEENVYPMIPAGGSYKDIIMSQNEMLLFSNVTQGSNI